MMARVSSPINFGNRIKFTKIHGDTQSKIKTSVERYLFVTVAQTSNAEDSITNFNPIMCVPL
jgi:hypothetical protein